MAASKQVKQRRLEDARARGERAMQRAIASQRKIDQARSQEDHKRYSSEQATHRLAVQVQGEAVRVQEEHIAAESANEPPRHDGESRTGQQDHDAMWQNAARHATAPERLSDTSKALDGTVDRLSVEAGQKRQVRRFPRSKR